MAALCPKADLLVVLVVEAWLTGSPQPRWRSRCLALEEGRLDVVYGKAESEPGRLSVGHPPTDRCGLSLRPIPRVRDSSRITDSVAYGQRRPNLRC